MTERRRRRWCTAHGAEDEQGVLHYFRIYVERDRYVDEYDSNCYHHVHRGTGQFDNPAQQQGGRGGRKEK